MLCTGGDTGGGLRGRGVAQAVLRLRRRQHLDDDLHCPVLRLRSHQERLLLQVRLQPYEYKYPDREYLLGCHTDQWRSFLLNFVGIGVKGTLKQLNLHFYNKKC